MLDIKNIFFMITLVSLIQNLNLIVHRKIKCLHLYHSSDKRLKCETALITYSDNLAVRCRKNTLLTFYPPTDTNQSSTAEQDHEDDEALKPVVLHYPVTGLS